ncbi:MAG: PBP1A family penicillin-binding protein [Acidimicrobiales bacterium]
MAIENRAMKLSGRALVAPLFLGVMLVATASCSYEPTKFDVSEPALATSTKIYAADGTLITTLLAEENRELVELGDLAPHVVNAVIAIEDARFFEHKGVDGKAVMRALRRNTEAGKVVEGGSTITQQYIKNILGEDDQTVKRKLKEASLAIQLEKQYTKERILELYLNTIFLGNGAYGMQAAAHEYFGSTAEKLTLAQSATLAGLIRAPSASDPYDLPEQATIRRNEVLDRMAELDLVESQEADLAKTEPLGLKIETEQDRYPAPHFIEQVKRFVLDDSRFGETSAIRQKLLFRGGLRITTSLDLHFQTLAEDAVNKVRPREPGPDAALVSIDPGTGAVRALVGGRDFFSGNPRAKLDLATGGPGRPAGSSFKPFVLAAALEKGIKLEKVYAAPTSIELNLPNEVWRVENYEGSGGGRVSLREATIRSYNTVYAQLVLEVGPQETINMATLLGITDPLKPFPSAALGTNDVHALSMASAFGTFATRGLRVSPTFVETITRSDGTVLYQHQPKAERVLPRYVADQVNSVLRQVIEQGTGTDARIGRPAAGKTGTGQAWRDAWFVGYTPELVTAVWVGFADEGRRSMIPPITPFHITGGSWPAQIWQLFMTKALADLPASDFVVPVLPMPPTTAPAVTSTTLSPSTLLPNVFGIPNQMATETLESLNLKVQINSVANDEYPPGIVVGQKPSAGTLLSKVKTVTIDVANGSPASGEAPSVVGLSRADAVAFIKRGGFRVEVVEEVEPGLEVTSDQVWKQSPASGGRAAVSQPIRIWVNPAF